MSDKISTAADQAAYRNIGHLLSSLDGGNFGTDLDKAIQEINAELSNYVIDFGGKPSATLTITMKFTLDGGVVEVTPASKSKLPDRPRGKTPLWLTADNCLTPRNPAQGDFGFSPQVVTRPDQQTIIAGTQTND